MSPLAADPVRTRQDLPVDDDAPSHSISEDDAKDGPVPLCGAKGRLGQGAAVGIVGKDGARCQEFLQISGKRGAVQAEGIGVLQKSCRGNRDTRGTDTDPLGTLLTGSLLQLSDQLADLCKDVRVALG